MTSRLPPSPDAPLRAPPPAPPLASPDLARLALAPPAAVPVLVATSPPSHPAGRCRLGGRPGGYRSRPAGNRLYGHSGAGVPMLQLAAGAGVFPRAAWCVCSSPIESPQRSSTMNSDGRVFLPRALPAARHVQGGPPADPDRPRRIRALGARADAPERGRQQEGHPATGGHPRKPHAGAMDEVVADWALA